ncbi:MAG TPA: hypothetical protein VK468_09450 [Pyrinomonadaceae bacterium]|jgi:hypothetical protein|nr:hypothetical protein [Pyrinomonadaceae bacterium]
MKIDTTQTQEDTAEPEAVTTEIAAVEPAAAELETIDGLRRQLGELRSAVRRREAHDEMTRRIAAAGARSPELLTAAVQDKLQIADDGTLQNAEAVLASLKAAFPEQFGHAPLASIDAGSGAAPARQITKESLARMTPDQIAKLDWAAVKQVLAA